MFSKMFLYCLVGSKLLHSSFLPLTHLVFFSSIVIFHYVDCVMFDDCVQLISQLNHSKFLDIKYLNGETCFQLFGFI